jgi:hypothetical protein
MDAEPIFRSLEGRGFQTSGHARGPWDPDAQHGGAPAALIVREIERLGTGLSLARLTVEFLGQVPIGVLDAEAAVVRPGRRFAVAEARLSSGGRACCLARATLVRREPVEGVAVSAHSPPMPPPERGEPSPFPTEGEPDGFHRSAMEIRFVGGDYGLGPSKAWFRLRRPLVDDEPATPLLTLAGAADFGNGISRVLDFERFLFVNLDLTIQVTRAPRGEWIGLDAHTEIGDDGTGISRSVLHDLDGPVGYAAQTLFVAPR